MPPVFVKQSATQGASGFIWMRLFTFSHGGEMDMNECMDACDECATACDGAMDAAPEDVQPAIKACKSAAMKCRKALDNGDTSQCSDCADKASACVKALEPHIDTAKEIKACHKAAGALADACSAMDKEAGKGKQGKRAQHATETKTVVTFTKAVTGRTVTGYAAIMGNVDDGGDRIWPGAFAKTIAERLPRIKWLWGHDASEPPTAAIRTIKEVPALDMPPELRAQYPEAVGALEVTREYLPTEDGEEILQGIMAGAITEMSIGYDPVKWDYETLADGRVIRNLRECRLWEASDVLWGMNSGTMNTALKTAAKVASTDALVSQVENATHEFKVGRVLSKNNLERLKAALATLQDILFTAEPPADDATEEDASKAMKALTEQIATRMQIAQREAELFLFSFSEDKK